MGACLTKSSVMTSEHIVKRRSVPTLTVDTKTSTPYSETKQITSQAKLF